jgi:DNA helicase-2/ATP-dependent DNA helicase PcrA
MLNPKPSLESLWQSVGFDPDENQQQAIEHPPGSPLFLTAGPGSGKTRVLLWRTVNLVVHYEIKPEEIFLSTFTEKAALQLKEGLRALLANVTERTGKHYDLSHMYIGTLHSLCRRLMSDRRFSPDRQRPKAPLLLDALSQYLMLNRNKAWQELVDPIGWHDANAEINNYFDPNKPSSSRHHAVSNCINLFNRFSEECVDPAEARKQAGDSDLAKLIDLYEKYCGSLEQEQPALTDFSLLQQAALKALNEFDQRSVGNQSGYVFKHVIIDEYQDTNTIQERLIFKLSSGHKNLCVVGDDDQALYRFRGATVENFVEFEERCWQHLRIEPMVIPLEKNYRSRKKIVAFYNAFITHSTCDWRKGGRKNAHHRVVKDIQAHRDDDGASVIASDQNEPRAVCAQIAGLVKRIIETRKVEDPSQIAFLYPSLKSEQVKRMMAALEDQGIKVYAPRASTFLDVPEAAAMLGVFMCVFGKPEKGQWSGRDYDAYFKWVDRASGEGKSLMASDAALARYVQARSDEIAGLVGDYEKLLAVVNSEGWGLDDPYDPDSMKKPLLNAHGLSKRAKKTFNSPYIERLIRSRSATDRPYSLKYVIIRATSLDWNVLDLFYRLCGFRHFRKMFDQAESAKKDEGPVCNLSLLSQYLARFMGDSSVLSAQFLTEKKFRRTFFSSYLYALYRRGESEYEDAEDPFPRGRIPFLTIHQAKGLEFPVVVLGNPRKKHDKPQRLEEIVHPLLNRKGEPLDRMARFDMMRMFYVALSRPKNLLVIAHYGGRGQVTNEPFASMLHGDFPRISQFKVNSMPKAELSVDDLPKNYSYTGDFLLYKRCPRQYMAFRKYGFVPSRSQTMFFGTLVHQTIEDLHQHLIGRKGRP